MNRTKLQTLALLALTLVMITGCQESNKDAIIGTWEIYECKNPRHLGAIFTFNKEGTVFMMGKPSQFGSQFQYSVDANELYLYSARDITMEEAIDIAKIDIKNDKLGLQSIAGGRILGNHEYKFVKKSGT